MGADRVDLANVSNGFLLDDWGSQTFDWHTLDRNAFDRNSRCRCCHCSFTSREQAFGPGGQVLHVLSFRPLGIVAMSGTGRHEDLAMLMPHRNNLRHYVEW